MFESGCNFPKKLAGSSGAGLAGLAIAGLLAAASPAEAGAETQTYGSITASITGPDVAQLNADFDIDVSGTLQPPSTSNLTAYYLYEDASWYYNVNHRVIVSSGTLIDGSGFNSGPSYTAIYTFNKPAGTYKYTFVFGERSFGHSWYDVAAEIYVDVRDAQNVCGARWNPPLSGTAQPGRTFPLKFSAFTCDTGEFYPDENAVVEITNSAGVTVESFVYTGNPHTGIDMVDDAEQYHVNWDAERAAKDTYVITVILGGDEVLERTITLC